MRVEAAKDVCQERVEAHSVCILQWELDVFVGMYVFLYELLQFVITIA